jgi:uncharacterized protein (DUF427 family)
MRDYPAPAAVNRVEAVPRRIRVVFGGQTIVDTTNAKYVWELSIYPAYYLPRGDFAEGVLVDEGKSHPGHRGTVQSFGVRVGERTAAGAARVLIDAADPQLAGLVRLDWGAMDAWFEEDEQVFVHPRDPYTRVDALRSTRHVRVELDGIVLADSTSPVLVFETGLPTRYYLNRTDVDFTHLTPSQTVTACPYKGTTGGYWTATTGDRTHPDVAWTYTFPSRDLLPIAGLIAFYNERVDLLVDGELLERPKTHFS